MTDQPTPPTPDLRLDDLESCRGFVIRETRLQPGDLSTQLIITAGTGKLTPEGEVKAIYRPYYVAAQALDTAFNAGQLVKTQTATFRDPEKVIAGWLRRQASIDNNLALLVPAGFEALPDGTEGSSGWEKSPGTGGHRIVGY